jgi:hypothetical protein
MEFGPAPNQTRPFRNLSLEPHKNTGHVEPIRYLQTLFHAFLPFGDIVEVNLPKPENQNSNEQHRGFGYVEFETATDATDAIDNMDRSELYGSVIKVAPAKPQKDANEGLGSKTAIWEQVCGKFVVQHFMALITYRRAGWPSML